MNRPGMQRLLSLVKSGSVKAVIVRDLSRFSRNFLEGGHYLEFVFPAYGVRFISIKTTLTVPTMANPPAVWSWASPTC